MARIESRWVSLSFLASLARIASDTTPDIHSTLAQPSASDTR